MDVGSDAVGAFCADVEQLAGGVEFVSVVEGEAVGEPYAPAVVDVVANERLNAVFAHLVGYIVARLVGTLVEVARPADDPFAVVVVLSLRPCGHGYNGQCQCQ